MSKTESKLTTPNANRRQVTIFGKTNAGKSALFNRLLGQEAAIVSAESGTTTDPVQKAMELIPFGPIVLVDTAGFGDLTALGEARQKKTQDMLQKTDVAIVVIDGKEPDQSETLGRTLQKKKVPYITVISKNDLLSFEEQAVLQKQHPNAVFYSDHGAEGISEVKAKLLQCLSEIGEASFTLVGDLVKPGGLVVAVVPIDSEAPKGRLILPQVQLIRDCLDHEIQCLVVRDTALSEAFFNLHSPDLVVTDSQIFKAVAEIVPEEIPLTSFSMLMARQKGNFQKLIAGAKQADQLKPGDRILIAEACTHSTSHEDIGTVKIPRMLEQKTGGKLQIDFAMGPYGFPEDLTKYQMVVHCGACMITEKTMKVRQDSCDVQGVPITNYGILIAKLSGILERCCEIFE